MKLMRNLYQNTGTVAGNIIRTFSSTVRHVFKYLKSAVNDIVRFNPLYLGHKSNSTTVLSPQKDHKIPVFLAIRYLS